MGWVFVVCAHITLPEPYPHSHVICLYITRINSAITWKLMCLRISDSNPNDGFVLRRASFKKKNPPGFLNSHIPQCYLFYWNSIWRITQFQKMTLGSLTAACLKSRQAVIQQWLDQISIAIHLCAQTLPSPSLWLTTYVLRYSSIFGILSRGTVSNFMNVIYPCIIFLPIIVLTIFPISYSRSVQKGDHSWNPGGFGKKSACHNRVPQACVHPNSCR